MKEKAYYEKVNVKNENIASQSAPENAAVLQTIFYWY